MNVLKEIPASVLQLLFPHVCVGCGSDLPAGKTELCARCIHALPVTNFELHPGNPVEKKFWGRIPVRNAAAQYFFSRESLMQKLMHQFKYAGNRILGHQLGRMMGNSLVNSGRFDVDALVPMPLFASRERKRGFNQATVLCEGISEVMRIPILVDAVARSRETDTQTRKGRIERWQNMEGKFLVKDKEALRGRHILLVDDVITTGATLEACGTEIFNVQGADLSIATLCFAV